MRRFWPDCRQSFHNRALGSRIRLDANAIIDGGSNPLFAPKVALRRLNRNMPQKELDLVQIASRSMAESSTGPSQIVRRQLRHSEALGGFLHNVPNRLHRHAISPCPSNFVDPAEQLSSINCGCSEPIVEFGSHPIGNWNRSHVASLADQINNGPMLFALLDLIQSQPTASCRLKPHASSNASNARSRFPFSR
jgi:hypothetical protein